ncbi:MAG: class I SAM-dependent methyltransferase [Acidimicrobiales bacterium]
MTSSTDSPEPVDVALLLDELRSRVVQRRIDGDYPPDIEERLNHQLERVRPPAEVEAQDPLTTLRIALSQLKDRSHFTPERIALSSTSRVREQYQRAMAQAVARQVSGVLEQVQEYVEVLGPILDRTVALLGDLDTFVHDELEEHLNAALYDVERRELAGSDVSGDLSALRARVAVLEAERSLRLPFDEGALHEHLQGSQAELMDQARHLSELIGDRTPVLDLACGQGQLLEVLAQREVPSEGVDVRSDLVAEARRRGLPARVADPLVALEEAPDGSLGALVLAGTVEHLAPQSLVDLISRAPVKLASGGVLILAGANPAAVVSAAQRAGWDPRRRGTVGPEYLSFLCLQVGFAGADLHWSTPPRETSETLADSQSDRGRIRQVLFPPARFTLVAARRDRSED